MYVRCETYLLDTEDYLFFIYYSCNMTPQLHYGIPRTTRHISCTHVHAWHFTVAQTNDTCTLHTSTRTGSVYYPTLFFSVLVLFCMLVFFDVGYLLLLFMDVFSPMLHLCAVLLSLSRIGSRCICVCRISSQRTTRRTARCFTCISRCAHLMTFAIHSRLPPHTIVFIGIFYSSATHRVNFATHIT